MITDANYKELTNNFMVNRKVILSYAIQMLHQRSQRSSNLPAQRSFAMLNIRNETIHNTHCTFCAWLLPFNIIIDNLNAISCIRLISISLFSFETDCLDL